MAQIDDLPPLKSVIAKHALSAKKTLGQNFILDLNLTAKIARSVPDLKASDILEIGPGPGGLTRALLAEGARRVIGVEKDARCLPALEEISAHYPKRLKILHADALSVDLSPHLTAPVRVVANLPYNIGTALLIRWLTDLYDDVAWQSLTLMFQREVAERIVAGPGDKAYGRLSILAAWRTKARIIMGLPAQAFMPPPKVASALVHLSRRPNPAFPAKANALKEITRAAFAQRRKMLRSALKSVFENPVETLSSLGIDPTARAETISLEGFCALARAYEESRALKALEGKKE